MLTHFNQDRIGTLARLARDNMGLALLDELREQHTTLLKSLQSAQDEAHMRQLQGACRAVGVLIEKIQSAPDNAQPL